ncbi:GNAT family N-acetyltransferase [Vibrio mediterranei]|jgi:N-acetylglutamate synthase-like GNAT family acetyltransferase|uniref:GNAT family N-acetyltransferase n=1 Tax=Vibrio TaxID=662 RepID=UPI0001542707|nr:MULTISPECIES: GNAT family N-acetyltransferase [Vibrio]EDL52082.1 Histone acetyltransferase HPA2/related acetyltransferase [Vibrio mediterranei AK1]KFA95590.1 GNAT family acetyltransferase [Vibrio sp. ER1A]MCF4173416.1 GNAT family N-acetyltransferase [Vibrio sp. McD22-P3]MCY9852799.1 GNAT family N-acetyltransferase [Vibrio mediterranei]MDA0109869.1 GNAT family N-acetyltransferase [Vibrio sp. La 4.2.2]
MSYFISSDKRLLDIPLIHRELANSYWAKGIPLDVVEKSIEHSLCFGVYTASNEQVGFARMITDRATFAYLSDVFVVEKAKGEGLGKQLIKAIDEHPELQGLRRIMLATSDAHGLYRQFGYQEVSNPQILMQKWNPAIYD